MRAGATNTTSVSSKTGSKQKIGGKTFSGILNRKQQDRIWNNKLANNNRTNNVTEEQTTEP